MDISEKLIKEQEELNNELASFLHDRGVRNLSLTAFGNSISSGYSLTRTIKPLLLRNDTISSAMSDKGIKLERHNFARAQNNSDEHLFDWLQSNITESDISRFNRLDYSSCESSMITHGLDHEKIEEYYPTDESVNATINDVFFKTHEGLANIIIYNGCTGSFLDAISRKGALFQQLFYGVKRDTCSLEAILKYIQYRNRKNNSNTQVYICGVPNLYGIKVSELINSRLKKIAKKYANTVYVEPVKAKMFYEILDTESVDKKKHKTFDVHYDEEEYTRFNNNILKSIIDNYETTRSMIDADRRLNKLSISIETSAFHLVDDSSRRKDIIDGIIGEEYRKIDDPIAKKYFLIRLKNYLISRFPYDFYFLGKKEISNSILDVKAKEKKKDFGYAYKHI